MLDSGLKHPSARDWLAEAAEKTLDRIRADRANAPDRVARILRHLEDHIFDPNLDYEQLRFACRIRDHKTTSLFHEVVGIPPGTYIRQLRLETASRLLAQSDIEIWKVAELVGYSSIQAFGRAFKRWSRWSPSRYRAEFGCEPSVGAARSGPPCGRPSEEALRQALIGGLAAKEARILVRQLAELYSPSRS